MSEILTGADEERERLLDKAKDWHARGMLTEREYGAFCALMFVDSIEAVPPDPDTPPDLTA